MRPWEYLVMLLLFAFVYIWGGHAYHVRYAKKRAPKLLSLLYAGSQGRLALPVVIVQAVGIGHALHTLGSQWMTGLQDRKYAFVTGGVVLVATLLYWSAWRARNRPWLWD